MSRRLVPLLLAVLATVGLVGCGVRLESPDPPTTAPDTAEQHRQELALSTQQLAADAEHASSSADLDVAELLGLVASDAQIQLDALGGVWEPAGRHLAGGVPQGDAGDVLAQLSATAAALREDAVEADGTVAPLLAGISVSRSLRADQLGALLGAEPATLEPALPGSLDAGTSVDLVRTVDAIGQAWEISAARASGDAQGEDAERAERWRGDAQELATLAGVADTGDDPRDISYDLDTSDLPGTIAGLRDELMECWLAQVPSTDGEDRGSVIDLGLTAARDSGLSEPGAEVPPIAGLA